MTGKRIVAPSHLRPETREWYRGIVAGYTLESHHLRLLLLACECWDRSREAREILQKEGLTSTDKYGQLRTHPCVLVEKDSRSAFMRAVRELGLDLAPEPPRPPIVKGRRAAIA